MARKPTKTRSASSVHTMVDYRLGDRTYQIDPDRQKVYRRFVEIETSKAIEIYSAWRNRTAQA